GEGGGGAGRAQGHGVASQYSDQSGAACVQGRLGGGVVNLIVGRDARDPRGATQAQRRYGRRDGGLRQCVVARLRAGDGQARDCHRDAVAHVFSGEGPAGTGHAQGDGVAGGYTHEGGASSVQSRAGGGVIDFV